MWEFVTWLEFVDEDTVDESPDDMRHVLSDLWVLLVKESQDTGENRLVLIVVLA